MPFDSQKMFSRDLGDEVSKLCDSFRAPYLEAFGTIPDILDPVALGSLHSIQPSPNTKCETEKLLSHPIGRELVRLMGSISLSNPWYQLNSGGVIASLKNETGDNLHIKPHRDLLDGHAVLFNWGVQGDLKYMIDGEYYAFHDNELVVINGAADWLDVSLYSGREWRKGRSHFGGVTVAHGVQSMGWTTRNRLLVYADGQETRFTQIPVSEDDTKRVHQHYLNNPISYALRPELPRYGEKRTA